MATKKVIKKKVNNNLVKISEGQYFRAIIDGQPVTGSIKRIYLLKSRPVIVDIPYDDDLQDYGFRFDYDDNLKLFNITTDDSVTNFKIISKEQSKASQKIYENLIFEINGNAARPIIENGVAKYSFGCGAFKLPTKDVKTIAAFIATPQYKELSKVMQYISNEGQDFDVFEMEDSEIKQLLKVFKPQTKTKSKK